MTKFKIRKCLYELLAMHSSLFNALEMFIRLMNDVLHPYLYSCVIVYLVDILVYISTWEYHISHVMWVLETKKNHHLLNNLKKYDFFLGIIGVFGVCDQLTGTEYRS
jgi:hypothetical protein